MSYQPGRPESYPPPPPPGGNPYGYGDDRSAPRRPGTLLAGCIMTWIGSSLGLLVGVALVAAGSSDEFLTELPSNVDRADAQSLFQVIGAVVIVWCLLTLVFSILAFTGKRWAAIVLVVLGGLWVAFSLYGMATGGGGVQALLSIVYVGVASLLVLLGSKEWFDHKAGSTVSH